MDEFATYAQDFLEIEPIYSSVHDAIPRKHRQQSSLSIFCDIVMRRKPT